MVSSIKYFLLSTLIHFVYGNIQNELFIKFLAKDSKNNSLCEKQWNHFQESFEKKHLWARKMQDSWGHFPSGTFSGNNFDFGNFDQCINFHHYSSEAGDISGQHCTLLIPHKIEKEIGKFEEVNIGVGICVPAFCDPSEVKKFADEYLKLEFNLTTLSTYEQTSFCSKARPPLKFSELQIFAIIVFAAFFILIFVSSVYEVYYTTKNIEKNQMFCSFSIFSNSKVIMTMKPLLSNEIVFLHGFRALSIAWIVFGHSYMFTYRLGPTINANMYMELIKNYSMMFIFSGVMGVNTFFMLSSFLMTMSVFRELDRTNKINLPVLLIKRYIRITVPLASAILLTVTFLYHISDGPLWDLITKNIVIGNCGKFWWTSLLYIGNYVNPGRLCFGHSWYLMIDMQLYLLSPMILYPLWKLRKYVKIVITLIFLIASSSVVYVFTMFIIKEFRISFLSKNYYENDAMIYTITHARIDSWMMGILVGYIMHSIQGKEITLKKNVLAVGWIMSISMIVAVIMCQFPMQQKFFDENSLTADATYEALKRIIWCMAVGWIIIACHLGYGGFIKSILSLPIWLPISKLSFCIYLCHIPIQVIYLASMKAPQYFSHFRAIYKFCGDFGVSVLVAFAWALVFEYPTLRLISTLLVKRKQTDLN